MDSRPLVSIIIPTYNYASYLPAALQSCLDQSYKRLEVIVIDDGSTDDTGKVVRGFGRNITYSFQEHRGVSSARNAGLERATGSFVAFLDADDYLTEDSVKIRADTLSGRNDIDFVVTDTYSMRMGDDSLSCGRTLRKDLVSDRLCEQLLSRCLPFATCSVLVKGDVARMFRFPVHLANGEDLVYFGKVFFRRRGCFLTTPTAVTRSHPDSLRHCIDEIARQGLTLVDTIFNDPYYGGSLEHLRRAFLARRSVEFFRRFYQSGDEKAAGAYLIRAIAAEPRTALKIEYWAKMLRLYLRTRVQGAKQPV